jgi:2-oxoglutarate dehydrogenase E2 component (dihydrolipoamide succinyltransferase)
MSLVDLIMPKLGESIMEATILRWHKQPGDKVAMDETILDIATDKVDSEVPSTAEGVIEAILYKENDVVPIGTVIAKIKVGARTQSASPVAQTYATAPIEEIKVVDEIPYQPVQIDNNSQQNANRFYSPLVLNIAQAFNIHKCWIT